MNINVGLNCLLKAMDHFLFIFDMSVTTIHKSKSIPFSETNQKVVQTVSARLCCHPNPEYLNTIIRQYHPKRGIQPMHKLCAIIPSLWMFIFLVSIDSSWPHFHVSNSRLPQAANCYSWGMVMVGFLLLACLKKTFRCCNCYSKW